MRCTTPSGSTWLDLFHTLLVLEGSFHGVPGSILHFYAVACYNLQHPDSVGLTGEALGGLRRNLADALDEKHRSRSNDGAQGWQPMVRPVPDDGWATRRWSGITALGR